MEALHRIDVSISGVRPLLQNAFVESQSGTEKKGQSYDDHEEAEKRLIKDQDGKICHPANQIEGSMVRSATDFKFQGKKSYKDIVKAGVFVEPLLIPLSNQEWVIDKRRVVVNRAGILRCRPRFDNWELIFTLLIREERLQPLVLRDILINAGKFHGIGDFRPRFGLFDVNSFQTQ